MLDRLKSTPEKYKIINKISESLSLDVSDFEKLIYSKIINACWDFKTSKVDVKKTRKFFNL